MVSKHFALDQAQAWRKAQKIGRTGLGSPYISLLAWSRVPSVISP